MSEEKKQKLIQEFAAEMKADGPGQWHAPAEWLENKESSDGGRWQIIREGEWLDDKFGDTEKPCE